MSRTLSRRSHPVVLAAVAAGALMLAGCGEHGAITISSKASTGVDRSTRVGGATLAALRSAGESTTAVTSGRYESTIADGDGNVFMTLSGEFAGDRTHQSTTLSGLLGEDSGSGGLGTEMISDGATLYFGGAALAEMAGLFGGGDSGAEPPEWYRFDVPEGGDESAFDGAELFGSAFGQDVGKRTAALLSGAYGEVTTVGPEDVRGIATTHSRVDVDLGKVVGDLGGLAGDLGTGTIPVDVWLGHDGLVHRMRFALDTAAMGVPGEGAAMVSTFELWDVGADITIDVPENAAEFDPSTLFGGR